VVPTGKVDPGVCDFVQTRLADGVQLSVAVGSTQVTTALQSPGSLVLVIFDGQPLITGTWLSVTVTVKLHIALILLAASLAV
jgi:hypothetical protein